MSRTQIPGRFLLFLWYESVLNYALLKGDEELLGSLIMPVANTLNIIERRLAWWEAALRKEATLQQAAMTHGCSTERAVLSEDELESVLVGNQDVQRCRFLIGQHNRLREWHHEDPNISYYALREWHGQLMASQHMT